MKQLMIIAIFTIITNTIIAQGWDGDLSNVTAGNNEYYAKFLDDEDVYKSIFLNTGMLSTEQEYIYATKGIKNSIENALDIKSGYTLNGQANFEALTNPSFRNSCDGYGQTFAIATLERTQDKSIAGIVIKTQKNEYLFYSSNSDYHERFFNSLYSSITSTYLMSVVSCFMPKVLEAYQYKEVLRNKSNKSEALKIIAKQLGATEQQANDIVDYFQSVFY